MRNFYAKATGLLLTMILLSTFSFATSIPIRIVEPNTVYACSNNLYIATFKATSTSQFLINVTSQLINQATITCPNSTSKGLFIKVDSIHDANAGYGSSYNASNGECSIHLTPTSIAAGDSVKIYYSVYIDCSALPPSGGSTVDIKLKQTWIDSTNANIFVFSGVSNPNYYETPKINYIEFTLTTPAPHPIGYLEIDSLKFMLVNATAGNGEIVFSFYPDSSNYCGSIQTLGLKYQRGLYGSQTNYLTGSSLNDTIHGRDTLVFTQIIRKTGCISSSCNPAPTFRWHCQSPTGIVAGTFCDSCQGTLTNNYIITNRPDPSILIRQLAGPFNRDSSCANDASNMPLWVFSAKTSGQKGALDTFAIDLRQTTGGIYSLTQIPDSSFHYTVYCAQCSGSVSINDKTNTNPYYSILPNAIDNLTLYLRNFGDADSVVFQFRTMRCIDSLSVMLNTEKSVDNWCFEDSYLKGICDITHTGTTNKIPTSVRNGIDNDIGPAINPVLFYAPTVSDLSVPHGQVLGDSAYFEIEMHGYESSTNIFGTDMSVFGTKDASGNLKSSNGILRATIACQTGIRVPHPSTDIYFSYVDTNNVDQKYYPQYYYTTVPTDSCKTGVFVYYFDTHNYYISKIFNTGLFKFQLQACCDTNNGKVPYSVRFDLLVNPSGSCDALTYSTTSHNTEPSCNGVGCAWLPLSSIGNGITAHCPGCKTPGIVIGNYRMARTSLGLEDSDNNGVADSIPTVVGTDPVWYQNNKSKIKFQNSQFGDKLEDYLISYFGQGVDPDGYSYTDMQHDNIQLPFLQLARVIPAGLDTMKLIPDSVYIYIDYPHGTLADTCIDCGLFNSSYTKFVTQRVFHLTTSTDINSFLSMDVASNSYLYTMEALDSIGQHFGNVYTTTAFWNNPNPNYAFNGFFETQQYRFRVFYSTCGNFRPSVSATSIGIDDIRKESEITNKMWLSGKAHPWNAMDLLQKNPSGRAEVDTNYHIYPDTGAQINQKFADTLLFNCENFDGLHYFFSEEGKNITTVGHGNSGCQKLIQLAAYSRTAGNIYDMYPYEYKPNAFQPKDYIVNVPPNYKIDSALVSNAVNLYVETNHKTRIQLTSFTGQVIVYDSVFNRHSCNTASENQTEDTIYHYGDKSTYRILNFYISPFHCDSLSFNDTNNLTKIDFSTNINRCIPLYGCAKDTSYTELKTTGTQYSPFGMHPHDTLVFQNIIHAVADTICFQTTITNPRIDDATTVAPYYFIGIPNNQPALSYLNPSSFSATGNGIPLQIVNNIVHVADSIDVGETMNVNVCAAFYHCPLVNIDTLRLGFYAGWNCNGFPTSFSNLPSICGLDTFTLKITPDTTSHLAEGNITSHDFALCDPDTLHTQYIISGYADVYPRAIHFTSIPQGMTILGVDIIGDNCSNHRTLTYNSLHDQYPITVADLHAVCDTNFLTLNQILQVDIRFIATCDYKQTYGLPEWDFIATNYCGDTLSYNKTYHRPIVYKWNGQSKCNTCFTLTKTASPTTVIPYQNVTYTITIHSQNQYQELAQIAEFFPSGFHVTSQSPPVTPTYIVPDTGTFTVTINGYFDTPVSCTNNNNTVRFNSLNVADTLWASACVTVKNPCIQNADTIVHDGDSSSVVFSTGYVQNKKIYIAGTFWITKALYLQNCQVTTAAGARIIDISQEVVTLDSTTIIGCDSMWAGIDMSLIPRGNQLLLKNHSALNDASIAIKSGSGSIITCLNSSLENNDRGIYFPDISGTAYNYNSSFLTVGGCRFGLMTQFKPDYRNQSPHGIWPTSGIEMYDVTATIGRIGYAPNNFSTLNSGIVGNRSTLWVSNIHMDNIKATGGISSTGIAIKNFGMYTHLRKVKASLTVNDQLGPVSISRSTIGISTKYCNLDASNCSITNVYTGVDARLCIDLQTSWVYNCTINASKFGIFYFNNNGAKVMSAVDNHITVLNVADTSVAGISCQDYAPGGITNYSLAGNHVSIGLKGSGILMRYVEGAKVTHNVILQNGINSQSNGISLDGIKKTAVSCNIIQGDTLQFGSVGIRTNISDGTSLSCNSVANTNTGFYFSGTCGNTDFRANAMERNYLGLYLNDVAAIGKQTHTGNRWLYYRGLIGALNADTNNVTLSEFDVHTTMGQTINGIEYFPNLDYNNIQNGWFFRDPGGSPYNCQNNNVCGMIINVDTTRYERLIAQDSIETIIYSPETKYQANEYLYGYLMDHPVYANTDFDFNTFFIEHQNDNIGDLYNIERDLSSTGVYFSNTINLVFTIDSLTAITTDSINNIGLLSFQGWQEALERMNTSLTNLANTREALLSNERSIALGRADNANTLNNIITPRELPEANRVLMNYYIYKFLDQDQGDTIIDGYEQILEIANQCPCAGGTSVYQARAIIQSINDSIEFDDDALCLLNGIFRTPSHNLGKIVQQQIFVRPNPANDIVNIALLNKEEGICNISIVNNLGVEVLSKQMNCEDAQINIDIRNLASGLYYIKINNQSSWNFVQKLVIER